MAEPRSETVDHAKRSDGARQTSARASMMRASIYEHAERLFAERGYAGTTPHDIADAVGISRQSLYYYVNGKHEILATLVSEMTTHLNAEMKSLIADMEKGLPR